ncbi:MAG TPA: 5-(carboxyamino)imidazole ribonucleotide synthase, partial [Gammaproteobacteria bacterium]
MRVGILGAGQLARMLALAGYPLGLRFAFLDPAKESCAADLGEHFCGAYDDEALLDRFAASVDLITYEFENVPVACVEYLAQKSTVLPPALALETAQDRLHEKSLFQELGITTPPFMAVDTLEGLRHAVSLISLPAVLKTRRMGYDGKGQYVLRESSDIEKAWQAIGGVPLILEGFIAFQREASIIAVRARSGEIRYYPLSENIHRSGILHISRCRSSDAMQQRAEGYIKRILEQLDYVGVLALELFQDGDTLIANEIAPRVHNSGHWTIEGAETSQFENHLRAVCGLPLGSTAAVGHAAMLNFIGALPSCDAVLTIPDVHLHFYGKQERSGRKVGHAT